jgi:DNA replication protein DnaC
MDTAIGTGPLDPQVVLIDARRDASGHVAPVIPIGALARYDRPAPFSGRLRRPTHREWNMSARTGTTAQAAIGAAARELHLPTVRTEADRLAEIAVRERQTHLVFLAEVLATEVDKRSERRRTRRITEATFPRLKRLNEFNLDVVPTIAPTQLAALASGASTLASRWCCWGFRHQQDTSAHRAGPGRPRARPQGPLRRTCAHLVNELVEAADDRALSRVVGRYAQLDLLLLDELGYVQIDLRGAELLFQIITEREERASIGISTNLPFSEWGSVFGDPRLVVAIVDRVTFNAHILETGTHSYRLATSKTSSRKPAS